MARKNVTDVQHPTPEAGGSYIRNPESGELALVERTRHESEAEEIDSKIPFENTQE